MESKNNWWEPITEPFTELLSPFRLPNIVLRNFEKLNHI